MDREPKLVEIVGMHDPQSTEPDFSYTVRDVDRSTKEALPGEIYRRRAAISGESCILYNELLDASEKKIPPTELEAALAQLEGIRLIDEGYWMAEKITEQLH